MANIKSIGGNPIVLGLDGLTEEAKAALGDSKLPAAAESLLGADSTAQWATRESTGSGAATVRSVQGAAVGWNQISDNSNPSITRNGVTFTNNGDGTITANGTATAPTTFNSVEHSGVTAQQGHVYLVKGCPAGGTVNTYYLQDPFMDSSYIDFGAGRIFTNTSTQTRILAQIYIADGVTVENLVFRPQLFDLTAMFGSGNEPSTVAEFERMFPEAYYPYSAPTLKPVQIAGISSKDAQGGELDSIEWPTQTLRAAGTIRDELTAGELVTRVGVVDLGTLTWYKADDLGGAPVYYAPLASIAAPADLDTVSVSCAALIGVSATYLYNNPSELNVISLNAQKLLWARHSAADAAAFKAAMQGAMLTYPIATPTTTPISPTLDMTYRVEQGGTEAIIVPAGEISAAPVLTVAEGESAGELVMDALACIAVPDGPTATSSHALNTYLTMQGKLYKVTSAIAVGETIKSGTNVTETTVMAELIARTA